MPFCSTWPLTVAVVLPGSNAMRVASGSTGGGSGVDVGGSGMDVGGTGVGVGGSGVGGTGVGVGGSGVGGSSVGGDTSGVAVAGLGVAACGAEQANIAAVTRNADKSSRVFLSLFIIVLLTQFTVEVPYSGPNSLGTILAVTGNTSRFSNIPDSASVASQVKTGPPVQASAPPLRQQSCGDLRGQVSVLAQPQGRPLVSNGLAGAQDLLTDPRWCSGYNGTQVAIAGGQEQRSHQSPMNATTSLLHTTKASG